MSTIKATGVARHSPLAYARQRAAAAQSEVRSSAHWARPQNPFSTQFLTSMASIKVKVVLGWTLSWAASIVCAGCGGHPLTTLTEQLRSDEVQIRRSAARELGQMGPAAAAAVGALQDAVADRDREVRRLSSIALGEVGPPAKAAVPALTAALSDDELSVRLAAAFSLQKLDTHNEAFAPVLIGAMRKGDGGVIVRVGELGAGAGWAVPTLISLLDDQRPGIRRISADALQQIGPLASAAEAALRRAASQDSDDRVRAAAQQALSNLSSASADSPQSDGEE